MYLPRIMLDLYGWPGFVAFAVPNVLGCAAFGYVLRSRWRAANLVAGHGLATMWFSVITVCYHMFFAVFVATELLPTEPTEVAAIEPGRLVLPGLAAMILLYGPAYGLSFLRDRAWLALGALGFTAALGLLVALALEPTLLPQLEPARPARELVWIAPILAAGFLLCPYLDLTFHRALRNAPSRHAFGVFGVAFAMMIVLSCFLWFRATPGIGWVVLAHLWFQSVFTVGAHLREIRGRLAPVPPARRGLELALPWLAGVGFLAARMLRMDDPIGVNTYLRFLAFYGLVFPAYVLLFIGPWRPLMISRRTLLLLAAVIVVLAPFYELGFVLGQAVALVVPTAAILIWVFYRRAPGLAD
jgi:hypothetical protein